MLNWLFCSFTNIYVVVYPFRIFYIFNLVVTLNSFQGLFYMKDAEINSA